MTLLIVDGAPLGEFAAVVFVGALGLLELLVIGVLEGIVRPGLEKRFGLNEWIRRQRSKRFKKKLAALGDGHKAPFQIEQRCKLSPTEEVWVRHVRNSQSRGHEISLEVLYSRNSYKAWERLPLRLSPWARFKCIMLDGEWPPTSASRNLSCDMNRISFEVVGADNWDNWPNVWRATYRPGRKSWTLKVIGPLWLEASSEFTAPNDLRPPIIPNC